MKISFCANAGVVIVHQLCSLMQVCPLQILLIYSIFCFSAGKIQFAMFCFLEPEGFFKRGSGF